MLKRAFVLLLALITLTLTAFPVYAEEASGEVSEEKTPDPVTDNVLVIKNIDSGKNLIIDSANGRGYNAGVAARLMTALVAYESIKDLKVKISVPFCAPEASLRGTGSYLDLKYSEKSSSLTLRDLLSAATVSAATDACLTLAVASMRYENGKPTDFEGDYEAASKASLEERGYLNDFVEKMNDRAKELGCTSTVFTNCTGLNDPLSKTTAEDIALIAAAVLNYQELFDLTNQPSYTLSTGSNQLFTKNALLSGYNLKGYTLAEAKGMIAGYLENNRFCVVTTAEENGLSYVFVCISENADTVPEPTTYTPQISAYNTIHEFMPWALKSFQYITAVSSLEVYDTLYVKSGKDNDNVAIVPAESIELLVTRDIDPEKDIQVIYDMRETQLKAPVTKGQIVGEVTVFMDGKEVGRTNLVTNIGVDENELLSWWEKIMNFLNSEFMKKLYIYAAIIFFAYIGITFLLFIYRLVRKYIAAGRGD